MGYWLGWFIAIASTMACLVFWFRDVRRIMREHLSMVECAGGQLSVCRKKAENGDQGQDTEVLQRSEKIYRQALDIYNQTLRKPWIVLPAYLMGFRARS